MRFEELRITNGELRIRVGEGVKRSEGERRRVMMGKEERGEKGDER